jgi:hypothetical protein
MPDLKNEADLPFHRPVGIISLQVVYDLHG